MKRESDSLRFEMRLPQGVVADLELMREHTGNTFAHYIRHAILRALEEYKEEVDREVTEDDSDAGYRTKMTARVGIASHNVLNEGSVSAPVSTDVDNL